MGLLSWLFPSLYSPEALVAKARALLERREFNDVRRTLDGVDHPDAEALRAEALRGLVQLNLDEAMGHLNAGNEEAAAEHLELARSFGATTSSLRELRREARRLREERAQPPEVVEPILPEGNDPVWSLPPDDPRLRYAAIVETYPEALRERFLALGPDFALAVLRIEEGAPAEALEALRPFAVRDPVARFERARAALAVGDLGQALEELSAFGARVGHHRIGNLHTAALTADLQARAGRGDAALTTIEGALANTPTDVELAHLRGAILEGLGRLEDAEHVASDLAVRAPRAMPVWKLLARVRLRQDNRPGAADALERGLSTCCGSPGRCGNQALDVDAARMLARLYLEDRAMPERAEELLRDLAAHVREPGWDDAYLAALVARNREDPQLPAMARRLLEGMDPRDPRARLVQRNLATEPRLLS